RILQDKTNIGWYVWPEKFTYYALRTASIIMPEVDDLSKPAYLKLLEKFREASFWTSFISYLSQESTRDREDAFSVINAHLFKSIFQMYEDSFLEIIEPEIKKLCKSTEKHQQRAVS